MSSRTAAIILAAGASRRMGTPKALLPFRGETFLDRLIGLYAAAGCDPVIVALGHDAARIRAGLVRGAQARFVTNPDPDRGQLTSLQCALALLDPHTPRFLFTPVDCPAVEAATVTRLLECVAPVVIPRYHGRNGHPVCAAHPLIAELLALPESGQARDVIRAHRAGTEFVDVDDAGVVADIDLPADYEQLLASGTRSQP